MDLYLLFSLFLEALKGLGALNFVLELNSSLSQYVLFLFDSEFDTLDPILNLLWSLIHFTCYGLINFGLQVFILFLEFQVLVVIRIKLRKVIHELQIIELTPCIMHLKLPVVPKLLLYDLFRVLDL